ncbi:MAG TPA: HAMP domain-containing sensor histidine kinase [Nannocystaceae bacterium]|nr:HAMP domain-containing sensor histidine kinase [Nannocystaceae bacterium]
MISDAIGEIGTQQRRAFDAHDYQMFNRCMDTSMAAAIDRHESAARSRRDLENTARLGALAHELRNALGSATMAFAILRGGKSGISSPVGDVLARSLTRMDTLVANTLAAVRLDIGRQDSTDIAVARLLQDLVAEAVVERGITIAVDVRGEPHVRCDEALLASAIANLLQNALKFTRADGRIELRASETESGTRIEVEDECGGLPAGVETSMFAPFRQNLPDRRGLGLGLAITREAIAACHGDIAVHDLPGKGCVFVIDLPRLERA